MGNGTFSNKHEIGSGLPAASGGSAGFGDPAPTGRYGGVGAEGGCEAADGAAAGVLEVPPISSTERK